MPDSPTTPSRRNRPGIARSYSANPRLSPPAQDGSHQPFPHFTRLSERDAFEDPSKNSEPSLHSSKRRHFHMPGSTSLLRQAGEKLQEKSSSFLHGSNSQQFDNWKGSSSDISRTVTRTNANDAAKDSLQHTAPIARAVRPEDVLREKRKREKADRELSNVLSYLNEQSNQMSRGLDHTYYLILEKARSLRATIGDMQELYRSSRQLHERFVADTEELQSGIEKQLHNFNGFQDQHQSVEDMELRVKQSKIRVEELSNRLEHARKRVAAWEVREAQWQQKVGFRLRMLSSCICAALAVLFLGLIIRQVSILRTSKAEHEVPLKLSNVSFVSIAMEILGSGVSSLVQPLITASAPNHQHTYDPRLDRLFDEL